MNILPLLLFGILLGGEKFASIKDLLSRIDFQSFAPVFQLLGVDKKTVDFLSSDQFSSILSNNDIKSLLPLLTTLFTKQNKEADEQEDSETENQNDYLSPIKNVAPTDVGATIESFLN